MVRSRTGACAVVALALAWTIGSRVEAQSSIEVAGATGAWFVELNGSPDRFRAEARAAGLGFSERFVYSRVWRGLSIAAAAEDASQMRRLSSVRAVYPVVAMEVGPVQGISPDLAHALAMTGADAAQDSGLTGAGVKVGVIDSGIDYHHPDLGGGFGAGRRVVTGYDFVGDRYDAGGTGGALIPHPDADPDDCNSHGTHVAGIVGASGNPLTGGARGVAPGVTFGAYRVFGCDGSTSADIMVAAMDRALADGMDVVNMSIGSAFQTWPQYPTAVAADALVDAGVVVVTSIGNSGASGVYSAGAPGVGRNVIGVASFDNSHVNVASFIANPGGAVIGYTPLSAPTGAAAPPLPPSSGTSPEIVYVGRGCVDGDLAAPGNQTDAYLADPAGKVALVTRGVCPFNEKYARAADAGAAGVIIQNNAPGVFFGGFTVSRGIFGIAISLADGNTLRALTAPTATWTDTRIDVANPTGGTWSTFSSYGLNAELQLKPNIGAPGGLIRSTIPLELGGYDIFSGTSMASPHVAGAAALLLEAHPDLSPADVKTVLQNSADPAPLLGFTNRDAVHRQGAGMLDIDDSIAAAATVTPSELSLGEGTSAHARTLTIRNTGTAPATFTLSHLPAVGTGGSTFAPSIFANTASVGFSATSVTVDSGGSAEVSISITPNTVSPVLDRSVYGGYIVVSGAGRVYRVPYAGFTGDYQTIQVLAAGACGFPGVFKLGGETTCVAGPPAAVLAGFTRQPNATIYNVEQREDRPVLLFHLAHQSRRLEIRAVDELTGASHLVASADYLARNATNGLSFQQNGFSAYVWDGKRLFTNASGRVRRDALPDGLYRLQVVVTKALAEEGNAAHVETWSSPVLNITRP